MNIRPMAVVLLRVASLGWLFNSVNLLIYLPASIAQAHSTRVTHLYSASSGALVGAAIGNVVLHFAFSFAVYMAARPLAGFLTRDLEGTIDEPDRSAPVS